MSCRPHLPGLASPCRQSQRASSGATARRRRRRRREASLRWEGRPVRAGRAYACGGAAVRRPRRPLPLPPSRGRQRRRGRRQREAKGGGGALDCPADEAGRRGGLLGGVGGIGGGVGGAGAGSTARALLLRRCPLDREEGRLRGSRVGDVEVEVRAGGEARVAGRRNWLPHRDRGPDARAEGALLQVKVARVQPVRMPQHDVVGERSVLRLRRAGSKDVARLHHDAGTCREHWRAHGEGPVVRIAQLVAVRRGSVDALHEHAFGRPVRASESAAAAWHARRLGRWEPERQPPQNRDWLLRERSLGLPASAHR
mmetsp:Transcript_2987/g.8520  ORF Transcript_2987/g.8520 Transcript_2987/m.8520 type:complete len:312 (+) Transcript_2987:681-1616(+)